MATRSHTTYKKRQKELARLEKQRDKAAKRMQRKLEKGSSDTGESAGIDEAEREVFEPGSGAPNPDAESTQ